jgi:long-chain acyl-CoA synthetase
MRQDHPILEKLAHYAAVSPEKIAYQVIEQNNSVTRLSYEALKTQAQAYAAQLNAIGVKPRDRVVIITQSHPYAMVAFLGTLMADSIPVPIDASLAGEHWLGLAQRVQAVAISIAPVLTQKLTPALQKSYPLLNHYDAGALYPDSIQRVSQVASDQPESPEVSCILMSSGTSGLAKAICLTACNLQASIDKLLSYRMVITECATYCPLPFHHVYPLVTGYLGSLFTGGTLTVSRLVTPVDLRKGILLAQPTVIVAVPPILQMIYRGIRTTLDARGVLAQALAKGLSQFNLKCHQYLHCDLGRYVFPAIREGFGHRIQLITTGGAHLDSEVTRLLQAFGVPVIEGYGLSETTGSIMWVKNDIVHQYLPKEQNAMVHLDDPDKQGCGEICYSGPQCMPEYFLDPEKTQAVIYGGCFHTGDIGRITRGMIEITGRKSDMIVTSGGKNVFPDEVEMLYHDVKSQVADFSVFGMPVGAGQEVHAVVVLSPYAKDVQAEQDQVLGLASQAAGNLPRHMMIKQFHFVDALPKASGFKVKRAQLPEYLQSLSEGESSLEKAVELPATETEKALLSIWKTSFATVLWEDNVIAHFFELGGDSLILSDIFSHITQHFGIEDPKALPFNEFLKSPTVRHQAKMIDACLKANPTQGDDTQARDAKQAQNKAEFHESKAWQRTVGGVYQLVVWLLLPVVWFLCAWPVYQVGQTLQPHLSFSVWALAPLGYVFWLLCSLAMCVLMKWLVIGRFKAGRYPVHGLYYYRWWTVKAFFSMLTCNSAFLLNLMAGTKLMTWFYKALGARIGRQSQVDSLSVDAWDMVTVGAHCTVAASAKCITSYVSQGYLHVAPVELKNGVSVGGHGIVHAGATVPEGGVIASNQHYPGAHELHIKTADSVVKKPWVYGILQWITALLVLPCLVGVPIALVVMGVKAMAVPTAIAVFLGVIFSLLGVMVLACGLKWILLGKLKPKTYRTYGHYAYRKWIVGNVFGLVGFSIGLFAGTPLHRFWLRCCGVNVKKRAAYACGALEAFGELVTLGEESFVGGGVVWSATCAATQKGYTTQQCMVVGQGSYVLYGACIHGGAVLEPGSGVSGKVSVYAGEVVPAGQQKTADGLKPLPKDFSSYARPSSSHERFWSLAGNLRIVFIFLCLLGHIEVSSHLFVWVSALPFFISWSCTYIIAKLYYLALFVLLAQKSVPGDRPMWYASIQKRYIWTIPLEWLTVTYILPDLLGTPMYNVFLRLCGAKIGKGVVCFGSIREADLLSIGDFSSVDPGTMLIGHMMVGSLYGRYINQAMKVGRYCSIGANNVVLPHSDIQDHVIVRAGAAPIFETRYYDVE